MWLIAWNDVGIVSIIILIFICMLIHVLIFNSSILVDDNSWFRRTWNSILNRCFTSPCTTETCKKYTSLRGDNYFMDNTSKDYNSTCMITGWEVAHFAFHTFLGFFYNIYISLGLSVGYEIYEYFAYDCASYADLGINFAGFLTGSLMRRLIL